MNTINKINPVVIIPAYNESTVIRDCLNGLYAGLKADSYSVIVACNGCSDNTAEIVEKEYPLVTCLNIIQPSKTNAINEAEQVATGFPRVYLDADVGMQSAAIVNLLAASNNIVGTAILAPRASIDLENSSTLVKWYYEVWQATSFFRVQGYGAGVYVLNKKTRALFNKFPSVISDDGFIRTLALSSQIIIIEESISNVRAPTCLTALIKIKTRSKLGNYELQLKHPSVNKNKLKVFERTPNFFKLVVYYLINLIAGLLAKIKVKKIEHYKWSTDSSSRGSKG